MSKKTQYLVVATIWAEGQAVLPGELYTPATAAETKRLLKAGVLAEAPSPTTQDDPPPPPPPPPENDPASTTTKSEDQDQADADTGADQDSAPGLDLEPPTGELDGTPEGEAKA